MNKLLLGAALGLAPLTPFAPAPVHAAPVPTHCEGAGTMLLMRPGTWTLYAPVFACGGVGELHASGSYDGLNFDGTFTSAGCTGSLSGTGTAGVWSGTASSAECGDGTVTITFTRNIAHVSLTFPLPSPESTGTVPVDFGNQAAGSGAKLRQSSA